MDQPQKNLTDADKQDGSVSDGQKTVWPPPPKQPQPPVLYMGGYGGELLTGINWIDAALGIPCGFAIGFALYAIAGIGVELISPPPFHKPQLLANCALGALFSAIAYVWIGRKYSLFAATLWIGGVPFYLLMFFLASLDL